MIELYNSIMEFRNLGTVIGQPHRPVIYKCHTAFVMGNCSVQKIKKFPWFIVGHYNAYALQGNKQANVKRYNGIAVLFHRLLPRIIKIGRANFSICS